MPGRPYHDFRLTRDADGVAWLLFDRADSSANTLSAEVIEGLDRVLAELETNRPTGLVIRSAKTSGFIAGADVNEFRGATDPKQVETRDRPRPCGDRPARSAARSDASPSSTASASAAVSKSRWPARCASRSRMRASASPR